MITGAVRYAVILVLLVLLSSLGRWMSPELFPFDLFTVAVAVVAVHRSPMAAQFFGLAAGLAQDVFSGGVIGLYALSKTTIGLTTAGLSQAVLLKGTVQRVVTVALATAADAAIVIGVSSMFGLPIIFDPLRLAVRMSANAVAGFGVLMVIRKVTKRPDTGGYEIA